MHFLTLQLWVRRRSGMLLRSHSSIHCHTGVRPCRLISVGAVLVQILALCGYAATSQTRRPNLSPPFRQGVVVEWLTKNSQAEKAGVQPGDVLLSWTRGDVKGKIESPFDLPYLRFEQASRGNVRVEGRRGQTRRSWLFGWETWGIAARPNFQGQLLSIYRDGQELAKSGNFSLAVERWRAAAAEELDSRPSWLLSRVAQILFDAQQWNASDDAYGEALVQAEGADAIIRGELLRQRATGFDYRNDLAHAEKYYEEAVAEWRKTDARTMIGTHLLLALGVVALKRGDLAKAEECFVQALVVVEQLAPFGSDAAVTFANLGVLAEDKGDLGRAEEYYRRALALEEQYSPQSHDLAQTLANLGTLTDQRGDPGRAEAYYRRALRIAQRLDPGTLEVALNNR
jgi:tetratricopeptide (TPR) repeat protein